jgi:uncharacterized protein
MTTRLSSIVLLLAAIAAHATSFDCSKATTPQEKAICSSPQLSGLDDKMAAAYKYWLSAAEPEWERGIHADQQIWLHTLARRCPAGDATNPLEPCLADAYRNRIDELHGKVKRIASVVFVWRAIVLTARDEPGSNPMNVPEVTPGFGTLQASWPQASATTAAWTAWNRAVEKAVIHAAQSNQKQTAHDWKDLVQSGVDQTVSVSITTVGRQLISVSILNFVDSHGAHPNHNVAEFHWLLDKQRSLRPEDVFRADSGWAVWMQKRLGAYLHKTLDAGSNGNYQTFLQPGEMPKALHRIVTDPESWKLDRTGLSLIFQPYEVACYACTPQPMTIPWLDLKPFLNPSFEIPQ